MATISGKLLYDNTRSGNKTANLPGIAGVPIVLQNTQTGATLAVLTDSNGNYSFTNVPAGTYQVVEQEGYSPTTATPGNFSNAQTAALLSGGSFPPISAVGSNAPSDATNLDGTTPSTINVTVQANSNLTNQNILNGPVTYDPLNTDQLNLDPTNLITAADNGTFGAFAPGTAAGTTANPNPYPNLNSSFTYVAARKPNDGSYTVQNTLSPTDATWWRIADHTTGNETGRMLVVNGANPGQNIISLQIPVTPNTNYMFSGWFANLISQVGYADPKFGVQILDQNGNVIQSLPLGTSLPANTTNPEWKQMGIAFNSGTNTSITIALVSNGPAANGNDYVIDDLKLQKINTIQTPTDPMNVQKNASIPQAAIGQPITYTTTLTNDQLTPMTNVTFSDDLAKLGLTLVPGSVTVNGVANSSADPQQGFSIPDLPVGGSATVTFQAMANSVPPQNPIPNQAQLDYSFSPALGLPASQFTTLSDPTASTVSIYPLKLTKTAPTSISPGGTATYTLFVNNPGAQPVTNATLSDLLPAGLTYVDGTATINGVSASPATGSSATELNLTVPTVAPNGSTTITFQAKADPNAATGATLNNTANLTYTPPGGISPTTTSASGSTTVQPSPASLSGSKSASPASIPPGGIVTYTVNATNTGGQGTTAFNIADALPTGLTYVPNSATAIIGSASSDVSVTGTTTAPIFTTAQQLAPGQSATLTFQAVSDAGLASGAVLTNTANLKTDPSDSGVSVSDPGITILPTNISQDSFTLTSSAANIAPGDPLTYTMTYQNAAPVNTPLSMSLPLPAGTAMTGNTATALINGTAVTLTNTGTPQNPQFTIPGPLPANSTVSLQVPTATAPNAASGTVISPTATLTNGSQNLTSNTSTTVSAPNFQGAKTVSETAAKPGDILTYTITATNTSAMAANPFTITENPLPAGLTLVGTPTATIAGTNQTVAVGGTSAQPTFTVNAPVEPGQQAVLTFQAQVPSTTTAGTSYTNKALIADDPDPVSSPTTTVTVPDLSDLAKTPLTFQYVAQGDTVSYLISGSNQGNGPAQPFVLTDNLPTGITTAYHSGDIIQGQVNGAAASFLVGGTAASPTFTLVNANGQPVALNPGATYNVTISGTVGSDLGNGVNLANQVQAQGYPGGPVTTYNAPATNQIIVDDPTFSPVAKKSDQASISPGGSLNYSVSATNAGLQSLTPVVTESLPSGVTLGTDPAPTATINGQTVGVTVTDADTPHPVFTLASPVPAGESFAINFPVVARTDLTSPSSLVNSAVISDTAGLSKQQSVVAAPVAVTSLPAFGQVAKTVDATTPIVGQPSAYTVTALNTGGNAAASFTAADAVSAGQTITGATYTVTDSGGNASSSGNATIGGTAPNYELTVPATIPVGDTVTIVYTTDNSGLTVNSASPNTIFQITSTDSDGTANTQTVQAQASITVIDNKLSNVGKSSNPANVLPGGIVTYTVTAKNSSSEPIGNITVADQLPAGLALVPNTATATLNGAPTSVNAANGNFLIPGPVAPGETVALTFQAQVPTDAAPGTAYRNTAALQAPGVDPTTASDAGVTVAVPDFGGATTTKTTDSSTVLAGSDQSYTVTATNTGTVAAPYLHFDDLLAAGQQILANPAPTATIDGQAATVQIQGTGTNMIVTITGPNGEPVQPNSVVSLHYSVSNSAPVGTTLVNAGKVTGYDADPGTSISATSTVVGPEVSLSKTGATEAVLGQTVNYSLTVTNSGNIDLTNVALTDNLPKGLTYVDGSATASFANAAAAVDADSSDPANPVFELSDVNIPPGESATVNFRAFISPGSDLPTATDQAQVAANALLNGAASPISATAKASFTTKITPLTGTLTKAVGCQTATPGSTIPFTLTFTALNPINEKLTLADVLPDGLSLPAGSSATLTLDGQTTTIANDGDSQNLSFALPEPIPAGDTVTISFCPLVDVHVPQNTELNNSASLTDGHSTINSNTATFTAKWANYAQGSYSDPLCVKSYCFIPIDITEQDGIPLKRLWKKSCSCCKTVECLKSPIVLEPSSTYLIFYSVTASEPYEDKNACIALALDKKILQNSKVCYSLEQNIPHTFAGTCTIFTSCCARYLNLVNASLCPLHVTNVTIQIMKI